MTNPYAVVSVKADSYILNLTLCVWFLSWVDNYFACLR